MWDSYRPIFRCKVFFLDKPAGAVLTGTWLTRENLPTLGMFASAGNPAAVGISGTVTVGANTGSKGGGLATRARVRGIKARGRSAKGLRLIVLLTCGVVCGHGLAQ